MNKLAEYIQSGILEMYALGAASPEEAAQVEEMAAAHPEIRAELEAVRDALENYATAHAVEPHASIKTMVLATIDFMTRLQSGEQASFPPVLNENSSPEDFASWTNRPDMVLPEDADDMYAKIIGYTPQMTTAIAWIKEMAPDEVHHDEFEKFLILEGTCEITFGDEVHKLSAGDYLSIPLHLDHVVKVTSKEPCKVILQRIAA